MCGSLGAVGADKHSLFRDVNASRYISTLRWPFVTVFRPLREIGKSGC